MLKREYNMALAQFHSWEGGRGGLPEPESEKRNHRWTQMNTDPKKLKYWSADKLKGHSVIPTTGFHFSISVFQRFSFSPY